MVDLAVFTYNLDTHIQGSGVITQPRLDSGVLFNNDYYGGVFSVSGVVVANGHVVPNAVVFLADGPTGEKAYKTVANESGGFEFTGVKRGPWTIYAVDPTATFNGDIYTHVMGVE